MPNWALPFHSLPQLENFSVGYRQIDSSGTRLSGALHMPQSVAFWDIRKISHIACHNHNWPTTHSARPTHRTTKWIIRKLKTALMQQPTAPKLPPHTIIIHKYIHCIYADEQHVQITTIRPSIIHCHHYLPQLKEGTIHIEECTHNLTTFHSNVRIYWPAVLSRDFMQPSPTPLLALTLQSPLLTAKTTEPQQFETL